MTDQRPVPEQLDARRYIFLDTGEDEYVIYDQQNPNGWIQSDTVTDLPSPEAAGRCR